VIGDGPAGLKLEAADVIAGGLVAGTFEGDEPVGGPLFAVTVTALAGGCCDQLLSAHQSLDLPFVELFCSGGGATGWADMELASRKLFVLVFDGGLS